MDNENHNIAELKAIYIDKVRTNFLQESVEIGGEKLTTGNDSFIIYYTYAKKMVQFNIELLKRFPLIYHFKDSYDQDLNEIEMLYIQTSFPRQLSDILFDISVKWIRGISDEDQTDKSLLLLMNELAKGEQ